MKRRREYHGCGEEYNVEKSEKVKQYHLPFNVKAVGKNIKWGRGEVDGNLGEKIKIKNKRDGEEYQVVGHFIHP